MNVPDWVGIIGFLTTIIVGIYDKKFVNIFKSLLGTFKSFGNFKTQTLYRKKMNLERELMNYNELIKRPEKAAVLVGRTILNLIIDIVFSAAMVYFVIRLQNDLAVEPNTIMLLTGKIILIVFVVSLFCLFFGMLHMVVKTLDMLNYAYDPIKYEKNRINLEKAKEKLNWKINNKLSKPSN
ncbi:hypothetical protein [Neisseria sp. Ec49-e6-T10]|uniref:hypothetical protein n=1 Tax=Neisseria sp. Ec49-e6-T10 TaxID=3140744 RepID=UPI003EB714FE